MKAMIVAAGLGTRLRPLTDTLPKALVPVAGIPMLERVIRRLKEAGFTDLTVNIHHWGEQILDFLHTHHDFGTTLHISDERGALLDTGGGIRKARSFLDGDEPFLVHNVDVITDLDLHAFYQHHRQSHADATLFTNHRRTSRYLLTDTDGRLCGWTNRSTGEVLPADLIDPDTRYRTKAFGCVQMLSPAIFQYMDTANLPDKFSIIPFYISICRTAHIQTCSGQSRYWFDIGKPETLAEAEQYLLTHQNS
ncbi:MAG: nucleotidyltransferase family protein [Prevotellaceae bacterium]|jgi:NDP-sugar pyrophosphorylase family protein|nr:nucleotidyltransferase family protein [Prevotellaceae bacterium]